MRLCRCRGKKTHIDIWALNAVSPEPTCRTLSPRETAFGVGSQGGGAVLGWNPQKGHPRARPRLPVPWEDPAGRP